MMKKEKLHWAEDGWRPNKELKKKAWVGNPKIYREGEKDPIKFWEKLAGELFWFELWKKTFEHNPPYFQWFLGGKTNITSNIFEKNPLGWEKIKDKIALIWEPEPISEGHKTFTYEELLKEVQKFSQGLKKLGVKKGDKVGIYLPMIPEIVISMLALAKIGAVHCVVFSAFSSEALKTRLKAVEAKFLITADGYYRRAKVINLKESASDAIKGTAVEKVICVRRLGNRVDWEEGRDFWFHEIVSQEKTDFPAEVMSSEEPFFILPESGTTGQFLPILHNVGGYMVYTYWTGKWVFDFHQDDILWSMADVGWVTGHSYTVYSPLLNGITTLIFEGAPDWPTSDRWAQIIEKHKVTIFYTSPTAIRMFRKNEEVLKKYSFENLRILGSVGEPIDESTWLWFFKNIGKEKCPLLDTYWQTETGGIIISSLPGIGPFKPSFAGKPIPGVKVRILDENGNPCSENQKGNLVLLPPFCPGMLRDIYNNPKEYERTYWSLFGKDVYFTADGAFFDKNGLIKITGRLDDVIKVSGHRLSAGELENIVSKNQKVAECAVIGVPDEIKGQVPIVFLVPKEEIVEEEIREEIKKELGTIALPEKVFIVQDLPKTNTGKIMRKLLKSLFVKEEVGDTSALSNIEAFEKIKKIVNIKE